MCGRIQMSVCVTVLDAGKGRSTAVPWGCWWAAETFGEEEGGGGVRMVTSSRCLILMLTRGSLSYEVMQGKTLEFSDSVCLVLQHGTVFSFCRKEKKRQTLFRVFTCQFVVFHSDHITYFMQNWEKSCPYLFESKGGE